MAYRQLSIESIAEYLQEIPEMKKVFSSFNELDIREIGDGNLNYVYLVKNTCLLYTSPSPRDPKTSRMPSSA